MSTERTVLLVEDNAGDVLVVREALFAIDQSIRFQAVSDGLAAINYLSGKAPYSDRSSFPLPGLVLLDLMLPILDGFYILEWVRTEPTLKHLPIVILATSSFSPDIKRAYDFGANSFITKPQKLPQLIKNLKLAVDHWLKPSEVSLPVAPSSQVQQAA